MKINVIKRDERVESFDSTKIKNALVKCFESEKSSDPEEQAKKITVSVLDEISTLNKKSLSIEEIQDIVVEKLKCQYPETATAYQKYRNERTEARQRKTDAERYAKLWEIIAGVENDITMENSNKDAKVIYTKRDLLAGALSRDMWESFMVSEEALKLHKLGAIHIHDTDYRAMRYITNCSIFNLKDMLDNGTVINGKSISSPKSLRTATTIATQIVMGIGNMQYGGITMSLAHLARYVDISRQKSIEKNKKYLTGEKLNELVENEVQTEVKDAMQTLQYQLNSMTANSGQSPFITVWMDVNEIKGQEKNTAMLIKELVKQRIKGMVSETGHTISPAFPKLIYVLDENNIKEGSEYFYLTELCAKCSSKRLTPDYISAKIMREHKEGGLTPAMGCVDKDEVVSYIYENKIYTESFVRFWDRMASVFEVKEQESAGSYYMDLKNIYILDRGDHIECKRIVKNLNNEGYLNIKFSNGRMLTCTTDHPLPINKKRVFARDVRVGDIAEKSSYPKNIDNIISTKEDILGAWALGLILGDGCYDKQFSVTLDFKTEQDIVKKYINALVELGVDKKHIKKIDHKRGQKGNYTEIKVDLAKCGIDFEAGFTDIFGGKQKIHRNIPAYIFNSPKDIQMSFLAGMIDSDGYINDTNKNFSIIQLGTINKEMSLQTMYLMESCGIKDVKIYQNKYKRESDKIRYRVEGKIPDFSLHKYLASNKKKNKIKKFKSEKRHNHNKLIVTDINFVPHSNEYTYDVTTASDRFDVSGISSHNCRSMVSPYYDEKGNYKTWGRFNIGVMSINLPYLALESNTFDEFMDRLLRTLKVIEREQLKVANDLAEASSDVAPMLWNYGAFSRLPKGSKLKSLIFGGYATASVGYAGLAEAINRFGIDYVSPEGQKIGLDVIKFMNDFCNEAKERTKLGFGVYGTPLESTTKKFANALKTFKKIKNVNDRDYVTNSYHVPVYREIDGFRKFDFEAPFQKYSAGGCISYIEVPDITKNPKAVEDIVAYMYEHIMYAEINTKNNDVCFKCNYEGEMENYARLKWRCPNCGNTDKKMMSILRRTCGYIGENGWNDARESEIAGRVNHL